MSLPPSHEQLHFNSTSTPPPPPPKPSGHSSGVSTPQTGPPRPPPPPGSGNYSPGDVSPFLDVGSTGTGTYVEQAPPEDGWLPAILNDKSTVDLHAVLSSPELQQALLHSSNTAHPSLKDSSQRLNSLLSANMSLATNLVSLEQQIQHARQNTQSRLLSLRALERQWRTKQGEQDEALRDFSAPALYQRLSAAVSEQEQLCRGLEESFLDGENGAGSGGNASEREVADFVRRYKEARKVAYLRREQRERWDEGRIGGWR